MHLTDGRCSERLLLKVLQLVPPVGAEVAADGFLQRGEKPTHLWAQSAEFVLLAAALSVPYHHLFRGHEVGALSDPLKDFGQLRVNEGII